MKNIKFILLILIVLSSCKSGSYILFGEDGDKMYLADYIEKQQKDLQLLKHPLVMLDGKPYRYDVELVGRKLPVTKKEITSIRTLDWKSGKELYGEPAKDGVVIISTQSMEEQIKKLFAKDEKTLFLLNGKKVAFQDMNAMNLDLIKGFELIKKKEIIKEYTLEDYDTIVVFQLKD